MSSEPEMRRQRGAALLIMMLLLLTTATAILVSRLSAGEIRAQRQSRRRRRWRSLAQR